jgi:hypothetical protein
MSHSLSRRDFLGSAALLVPAPALARVSITEALAAGAPAESAGPAPLPTPGGKWWEEEPLCIIDLLTCYGQLAWRSPQRLAREKAALGYNAEHLQTMNFTTVGVDDQGFFFRTQEAGKQNPDLLGEYLPEARKNGLRVFIYFNVHAYSLPFGEKHPEWRQIREDGSPLTGIYETATSFCVNSPYREWVFQIDRDLCAYPIDGVFYDGPIFFPETCYCRYCREKFRSRYGGALPSKKERQGKKFGQLLDFQAASLADFLRDSQKVIKGINPQVALYMNGSVLGGNYATGRLARVINPEEDLILNEGGFLYNDLTRVPLWRPGVMARLQETQAGGKPYVVACAAALKSWNMSLLPEPELRLLHADSIANGASVYFGMFPSEWDQPEIQALGAMNRFFAQHFAYYKGTRSEARVAVVWSDTTANFYAGSAAQLIDVARVPARSNIGNLEAEFWGLTEAIIRAHAPFDVLDDYSLEHEALDRYRAIFLPNVACMDQASAARLEDYVQRGGGLVASFETSLYDEVGVRREDLALAKLFGVHATGKLAGPRPWDYMAKQAARPLLERIPREWIPSPTYYLQVRPYEAQVLLRFTQPLVGSYELPPHLSEDAALTVHRSGQGTVVYCPGDLGNMIHSFHMLEPLLLIENVIRWLAPPCIDLENVPSSVELVHRSQNSGRRHLLHLINFNGEMTRPIRQITPLREVRVTLPPELQATRARTLVRPQELRLGKDSRGGAQFVIPRIDEYEVIVLE